MSNTPDDDDSDIELLAITREEAHRTVENQVRTLNDIDSKAARLLRINLVLLSILLTGLSLTIDPANSSTMTASLDRVRNTYTVAGLVLLLLSTGVAGVTYTASHLKIGMSPDDLRSILDNDYSDRRNVEGLVESYASWIEQNYVVNAKKRSARYSHHPVASVRNDRDRAWCEASGYWTGRAVALAGSVTTVDRSDLLYWLFRPS